MFSYQITNFLSFIISLVPAKILEITAHLLSILSFSVLRVRRNLMLKNLDIVYKESKTYSQKKKIAYLSCYNFFLTCFEFLKERKGNLSNQVQVRNQEYIDQALAQKKGAYIVCIHMGNWEALCGAASKRIAPAHVIVKKVGPKGMDDFVTKMRKKNGFNSIRRGKKGQTLETIKKKLDKNEIVGFVIDQRRPKSPKINFFGKPAKTNTSFAYIWRLKPAPVIPVFITRTKFNHHKAHILEPVKLIKTNNPEQDLLDHSKIFNQTVEQMILSCPEQYFWLHNRWEIEY